MVNYFIESEFYDKQILKALYPPYMHGKNEKAKTILNEEFFGKFDLQCIEYDIFVARSKPTGTTNLSFTNNLVNNAILF